MRPGDVNVKMAINGENVYQMITNYDLGIIKESPPPILMKSSSGFSFLEPS